MRSALLVIDVQQGMTRGEWAVFDADGLIARINTVIASARAAQIPIVFVQHEEDVGLVHGSTDWQLDDRLDVRNEDLRIRKRGSDSFHRTSLQELLASLNVQRVIACGLQSDFCVDSTARRCLALGFPVTLISDGHSTLDNGVLSAAQIAAHHNITLSNLASYGPRVELTTATDFPSRIESCR
jgi:nicotinamidase-related amidase